MKTTIDYLSAVQAKHPELTSDNKLAQQLGLTRQAISNYRRGQSMSVQVALRVAIILELNPMEPVAATMAHQAGSREEQLFWFRWYEDTRETE
jgi:predicted transcriptional regulator